MTVTRVAVTDDSELARIILCDVIDGRPELSVVAQASSIDELEAAIARTRPHVITLDLLMPGKAGLSVIRALSGRAAVIVVSDARSDSPLARESLAQGAYGFVPKRSLSTPAGRAELQRLLLSAPRVMKPEFIVAIAGSTGAMPALEAFAAELGSLDAGVVIVQHLPSERMAAFASWLSEQGLPASVAEHALPLAPGRAVVAPGHHHLVIVRGERAELDASPPVAGHTPSADFLFRSLVPDAAHTIAVVLSGMGKDGAAGIAPLVSAGASCFVQRPDTCPVAAMPMAALEAARGRAAALSPRDIGLAIRGLLGGRRSGL